MEDHGDDPRVSLGDGRPWEEEERGEEGEWERRVGVPPETRPLTTSPSASHYQGRSRSSGRVPSVECRGCEETRGKASSPRDTTRGGASLSDGTGLTRVRHGTSVRAGKKTSDERRLILGNFRP